MSRYYQGYFKPNNPQKYKGDPTNIIYRSWWEFTYMSKLDADNTVIEWASEEIAIPYVSPIDNRVHRYFIDFYVKKKNVDGKFVTFLAEIKPHAQTKPPIVKPKSRSKKYLKEVYNWGVNSAKWKFAEEFCKKRNWGFVILTEKELGIKT